jgi:hypothetical protein
MLYSQSNILSPLKVDRILLQISHFLLFRLDINDKSQFKKIVTVYIHQNSMRSKIFSF